MKMCMKAAGCVADVPDEKVQLRFVRDAFMSYVNTSMMIDVDLKRESIRKPCQYEKVRHKYFWSPLFTRHERQIIKFRLVVGFGGNVLVYML